MGTGGSVAGKNIQFDFRITLYATDEEVQKFAQLVNEQGTDALRRALEKEDKGRINAVGSTGKQLAVARKRRHGTDTIITMVTARNISFIELYNRGRTTDYPFGFLQVTLNAKNEGTGQIMAAEFVSIRKKGSTKSKAKATSTSKPPMFALGNDGSPYLFLTVLCRPVLRHYLA
jgi:hypothetical protein